MFRVSLFAVLVAALSHADSAFVSSRINTHFGQGAATLRRKCLQSYCKPSLKLSMSLEGDGTDSALWASLKKRIGSDTAIDSLTLPTADKMVIPYCV